MSGLVGGLETLCGQAYGAKQYHKLGIYTYAAIFSLILVCAPICLLWIFLDKILVLMRQDPSISLEARKYAIWLIPALIGAAISKPLVRYLQTQSLIFPMVVNSFAVLCFHVPASWVFIYKFQLGSIGAAMAFCVSNWLYVLMLAIYIKFSGSCKNTRLTITTDAFYAMGEFFRLAIPSAVMVCLKWWSIEVLVLLSGLLPNPTLETSVLSICLTISTLHFTIPYGLGVAASTLVSNELGAGNPQKARVAVWAVMFLAVTETIAITIALFCSRHVLGRAFSKEKQVVHDISVMTPLICLSIVTDGIQAVISGMVFDYICPRFIKIFKGMKMHSERRNFDRAISFCLLLHFCASGIARGSGWQNIGAYVNLGAFYLVGIPSAVVLGFVVNLKAKGLWIGIVIGSVLQSTILSLVTAFTNWQKQATKAEERVSRGREHPRRMSSEIAIE